MMKPSRSRTVSALACALGVTEACSGGSRSTRFLCSSVFRAWRRRRAPASHERNEKRRPRRAGCGDPHCARMRTRDPPLSGSPDRIDAPEGNMSCIRTVIPVHNVGRCVSSRYSRYGSI